MSNLDFQLAIVDTPKTFKMNLLKELGQTDQNVSYEVFDSVKSMLNTITDPKRINFDFILVGNCVRRHNGLVKTIFTYFDGSEESLIPKRTINLGAVSSYRHKRTRLTLHFIFGQVCYGPQSPHESAENKDEHLSISAFEKGLRTVLRGDYIRKNDFLDILFPGYDSYFPARWEPYHELLVKLAAEFGVRLNVMVSELQLISYPVDRLGTNLSILREAYKTHDISISRSTRQYLAGD